MSDLFISTKKVKEVVDITETVDELLRNTGRESGLVHLFLTHTTAALTTADLDPGTDLDMLDAFEAMVPKLRYRHSHDPSHVPDHIMSSLIGASLTLPFNSNGLILGVWQRVVLVELDGPRDRRVILSIVA
jgi:secondary thiamine-phosphate synthase enzyme